MSLHSIQKAVIQPHHNDSAIVSLGSQKNLASLFFHLSRLQWKKCIEMLRGMQKPTKFMKLLRKASMCLKEPKLQVSKQKANKEKLPYLKYEMT